MMDNAPIFIMSSERSGSNLLRTLLSNHSHIAGPVAPQLLPMFHNLAPYYGPLRERENALALMEDMKAVVNHPYYNWKLPLDVVHLYEKYHPRQFLDFFSIFYGEKQRSLGKGRFVCKENDLFNFGFVLSSYFEGAKFIYLYRDPRDYAASIIRILTGPKTPYSAALLWAKEQDKCNIILNSFNLHAHPIRYEELVADTELVMTRLLHFLDEPLDDACFQVHTEKNLQVNWNVAWKNLSRPVMTSNYGKYRDRFSRKTIRIIETVTQEPMLRLGYPFDTKADWKQPPFYRYFNFIVSKLNATWKWKTNRRTAQLLASRNALVQETRRSRKTQWKRDFHRTKLRIA